MWDSFSRDKKKQRTASGGKSLEGVVIENDQTATATVAEEPVYSAAEA
jgi:hypothetical protein